VLSPAHANRETNMRQVLTDLTVRSLPHPESGDVKYWDKSTPGFGVRVTARSKSFFVVRGKTRTLTTIGRYPQISLQDARREAKRLLVQPAPETRPTRLVDAVVAFLKDCEGRIRPNSVKAYRDVLRDAPDIALSQASRKTITATTAHEVKAYKALFNWCLREELCDRNPFQYSSVTFNQRSRVLTDDEIRRVWAYDHPPYSDIIKLCLLTGQRVGEVTKFNHAWIEGDTITIPASVAKNGKEHTLPFNLLTAHYLSRYLGNSFGGFSKAKARIDKVTGVSDWVVHDLRRTYSTTMASLGVPLHVTEQLLNHRSGTISGVAATYNRYNYLKEMRAAVLRYEQHIAKILSA
jgi:integrase